MNTRRQIHVQSVSELAHRLWEERGREEGHALEDWLAAERQLLGEQRAGAKPVDEGRSTAPKRRVRAEPPVKVPNPPELEVDSVPQEIPKLGSADAPGG